MPRVNTRQAISCGIVTMAVPFSEDAEANVYRGEKYACGFHFGINK
jgi:hypothetical protein